VRVTRALPAVLGLLCAQAAADEPPKSWFQLITVNAFASTSYEWNFNDPLSRTNQYRAFDFDHNSMRIDAAEVVLQKAVANPGELGFRLDLALGAAATIAAARGLFRDIKSGAALDFDLQQAFASYIFKLGHGLRLDIGKFVTPVGYELIDGYDGYNDNFSRSWLFTYGPYTHTGFKLTYPFSDKISAMVMLIDGWDVVVDNNAAKSFGITVTLTPVAPLAIYLNYIGGPERDNDNSSWRSLADVVVTYKPIARLSLALNADYGREQNGIPQPVAPTLPTGTTGMTGMTGMADPAAVVPPRTPDAQWAMIDLYLRVQATRRFACTVRGEIFWDVDGNRTGTAQRLMSATITPELRVSDALLLRAELRLDGSDHRVFEGASGNLTNKLQPTLALNAAYVF
jgi:hypothetical protein